MYSPLLEFDGEDAGGLGTDASGQATAKNGVKPILQVIEADVRVCHGRLISNFLRRVPLPKADNGRYELAKARFSLNIHGRRRQQSSTVEEAEAAIPLCMVETKYWDEDAVRRRGEETLCVGARQSNEA